MIRHRRTVKISYIFATALAIGIICLGSLINFHQYKIWGKPLIPQFVGIKRDVEKSTKEILAAKSDIGSTLFQKQFNTLPGHLPVACFRHSCGTGIFIILDLSAKVPDAIPPGSSGLRAPPVA
jgi:hypothetical protein